jgi:hypothetical protein
MDATIGVGLVEATIFDGLSTIGVATLRGTKRVHLCGTIRPIGGGGKDIRAPGIKDAAIGVGLGEATRRAVPLCVRSCSRGIVGKSTGNVVVRFGSTPGRGLRGN